MNARKEILSSSQIAIERKTALKWYERSAESYKLYLETGELKWLLRAEGDHHEALEHGSLVHDGGKLVGELDRKLMVLAKRCKGRGMKGKYR